MSHPLWHADTHFPNQPREVPQHRVERFVECDECTTVRSIDDCSEHPTCANWDCELRVFRGALVVVHYQPVQHRAHYCDTACMNAAVETYPEPERTAIRLAFQRFDAEERELAR